jgi:hypothetical protein
VKKTKTKPKKKWTGKPSFLQATKIRQSKAMAWMPDVVIINLDGTSTGKLLEPNGWSIFRDSLWPADRIEANMPRIEDYWYEENGKSWKLEIKPYTIAVAKS